MKKTCKRDRNTVCRYLEVAREQFICSRANEVTIDGHCIGQCGMDMLELGEDAYTVGLLKSLSNPIAHIRDVFGCEQWQAEAAYNLALNMSDYADVRSIMNREYIVVPAEEAEEWEGYDICEYSSHSIAVFIN